MATIGRRLYFLKATGEVVADIGEREGAVVQTEVEDDLERHPALKDRESVPLDYIELAYGTRRDEFAAAASMYIDPGTKELTIYPRLTVATDKVQIASDGVDTATIASDYAESFSVNDGPDYAVTPLLFASNVPSVYTITARSALRGQASVTVEVG